MPVGVTVMVVAPPPLLKARMPSPVVPLTVPPAVMVSAPLPEFVALMPLIPPETLLAETFRSVPAFTA